ncbi:uncharacterized protein LOC116205694 [Punica granatum]|uniref:Uncharacterized protein n=2 Tax=Punica granatum TaxID=22663 RepID=A0A218X3A8_PUNGR|nr:uncharacterized protein LOC116205694 [Punica granatum]OWM79715.1 hypothetical protein CDL15_Pgr023127 [Punica granatum]PKI68664.1 hypothetical protein CRG98_010944 [Punica granatum]
MSGLGTEEELPALQATFNKPELEGLCTHIKGIALESDDSVMEESNMTDPADMKVPPSPWGFPSPEPLTPMDLSDGTSSRGNGSDSDEEECQTPRGEEYRIPEILTCPPAPRRPSRNNTVALGPNNKDYFGSAEMEEVLKQEDISRGCRSV